MGGKVKIGADLMERVLAGTLSGPAAMEAEVKRREIAKARRQVKRLREKVAAIEKAADAADKELVELLG